MSKKDLIQRIQSDDPDVRGDAWQGAAGAGAEVLADLAGLMAAGDLEVSRAARRAMWKIVRHAGRPGAGAGKRPVVRELVKLLDDKQPVVVRREVLWMISELAEGRPAVNRVARLLSNAGLREDARSTLERIPGEESLVVLKEALESAPDDFKPALAQSLRARGVEVPGIPCLKLVPTRDTAVKAAKA